MGTPFYHTNESAYETAKAYQELHGFVTLNEALNDMNACWDDLDSEDRGALAHYVRNFNLLVEESKNGTR